jgi:hypothetical protein
MGNVRLLLRIGLGITFLYASISALISPQDWIWYIPDLVTGVFPAGPLLFIHSIFELILGIWLLSSWKGFYAAFLSAVDLFIIVLANITIFSVVFRDVGLLFAALALLASYSAEKLNSKKK